MAVLAKERVYSDTQHGKVLCYVIGQYIPATAELFQSLISKGNCDKTDRLSSFRPLRADRMLIKYTA